MAASENYEVLVLGSGEGGKYLAWHMAQTGHHTAVIERKLIGGSCPNTNCLPCKNEIWSAEVAHLVSHAAEFGTMTSITRIDMARMRARKREMVDGLIAMHLDKYKQSGAELVMGAGKFVAPKTIEVKLNAGGTRVLTGDRIVLNLGTHATIPERTPQGEQTIAGSDILVATGRTPNTAGNGLEVAGVELDERGYIRVNDRLQTSAADTWAIGECAGSEQFTHVSFDDFRIVRDNFAGIARSKRGRLVPFCMFVDPPLARVGLNESEAKRNGVAVRVAKLPMAAVLRTRTTGLTRGFMKALIDANSDRILGFTMIGPAAGEVMAAMQVAMLAGMPYTGLRDAIMTHPTMAEGLVGLFSAAPKPAAPTSAAA